MRRCAQRVNAGVALVTVVASACDAIIGLRDPIESSDAAAPEGGTSPDAGAPDSAGDAAAQSGCDVGATVCFGSCTMLDSDHLNCGRCGRSCLGTACVGGLCRPGTLTTGEPVRGVIVGNAVVWMTDHGLFTGEVPLNGAVPPPPTAIYTTDAGPLRSFALGPVGTYFVAVAPGDTILAVQSDAGPETVVDDAGDPVSIAINYLPTVVDWASSDPSATSIMQTTRDGAVPFVWLDAGSRPCGLTGGTDGLMWTSTSGTFAAPWEDGSARQQLTSTADFQVVEAIGQAVVAQNGDRFDLTLFDVGPPPTSTALVPGAHARAVAFDPGALPYAQVYFAAEGIFRVDTGGSPPTLIAPGSVPDECHVPQMALTDHYVLWVDRDTQQLTYVAR